MSSLHQKLALDFRGRQPFPETNFEQYRISRFSTREKIPLIWEKSVSQGMCQIPWIIVKHRVKGSSFFQSSRVKNVLTRLIHRAKPYLYLEISGKLMLITNSQNGVKQDMFLIMDWYNFGTQRLGRVHRFYDVINATIPHSTSAFQGGNVGEH